MEFSNSRDFRESTPMSYSAAQPSPAFWESKAKMRTEIERFFGFVV